MARTSWLPLLLVMGCAHAGGDGPSQRAGGDRAAAQRIYAVAEERYAAGDYDEAVSLMRHSLLQLPPSPEHDALRHRLVLRMAHTQLRDHAATGDAAPLHDARQMLERYLERHEALFGDGEEARAVRGEVYELLFMVERGLEPPVEGGPDEAARDDATAVAAREGEDDARSSARPAAFASFEAVAAAVRDVLGSADAPDDAYRPEPVRTAAASPEPEPEPERTQAEPTARSTDDEGHEIREVVVRKKRKLASLDDPRVLEALKSDFSVGWAGLVLTRPGVELLHGPRPLVRGSSRLVGRGDREQQQLARRAGRSLLRDARESLRGCYADAFARDPVSATDSAVEASIHPDGSISHVRIVGGGLVDGYGDACVIEALQAASVGPLAEAEDPVRVRVALQFIYESAVYIVEGTGEQVHAGGTILRPNPKPQPGLPPIEEFTR